MVTVNAGVPKPGGGGGGGGGGYIAPNNLTVSPNYLSMVFICIPSHNLTLVCIWAQVCTWIRGKKCSISGEDLFFKLLTWKKSWSRFIPPMLKIGQNWGTIAHYPPQCSTKICTTTFTTHWVGRVSDGSSQSFACYQRKAYESHQYGVFCDVAFLLYRAINDTKESDSYKTDYTNNDRKFFRRIRTVYDF